MQENRWLRRECSLSMGHDATHANGSVHTMATTRDDAFKKQWSGNMTMEWLEWEAQQRDIQIRHEYNNTEKRICSRRLPVDGFHAESQTVFQFHGKLLF